MVNKIFIIIILNIKILGHNNANKDLSIKNFLSPTVIDPLNLYPQENNTFHNNSLVQLNNESEVKAKDHDPYDDLDQFHNELETKANTQDTYDFNNDTDNDLESYGQMAVPIKKNFMFYIQQLWWLIIIIILILAVIVINWLGDIYNPINTEKILNNL